MSRETAKVVTSVWKNEGIKGAKVRRSIGLSELPDADPFLILDEFYATAPGGWPDHPHRGFEVLTYMKEGHGYHEDFCGRKGELHPGDVEWMNAGRGILHCEMPVGDTQASGLNLWINLPGKEKMSVPAYQELKDAEIPRTKKDGVWVKVISGESMGIKRPVYTKTPTMFLDFKLDPGAALEQPVPNGWTAFVYVMSGRALFGKNKPTECVEHQLILLSDGPALHVKNTGNAECNFVLIAGQPLREPIAKYGPFVMNTEEQIRQAISDFQGSKNGFENASTWASKYA